MATESRHILGAFEQSIARLIDDVRKMGTYAQENLRHAAEGLLERNSDLCNRAIADDEKVDELEKEVDREGVELIMKFGPVSRDLRRIISSMKAASAIERCSDHAVALAKRAKNINQHAIVAETESLRVLYTLASAQLMDAVTSFCDGNLEAALNINGRDTELDAVYRTFNKSVVARMKQDPEQIPDYVDLMFCARFIERIGDQSCNIAEDAVYFLTAKDIRHGGPRPQA
jgi:phosphate transport system protein